MTSNTIFNSSSGEQRWVDQISKIFNDELVLEIDTPACIFGVPKNISAVKPEAYTPQLLALGPYHHLRPELYEMERYKIDVAKRVLRQHSRVNIQDLIPILERLEPTIRACYHKYLDLDSKTLAWIIAIDSLFLLGIFSELANENDIAGKQLMKDDIHRDMVMLENQIPMVSLKAISDNIVHSSSEDGGIMMLSRSIFERFRKPISGIVDSSSDHPMDECVCIIDDEDGGIMMLSRSIFERFCAKLSPLPFQPINAKYVHLLDLMLQSIVIEPQDKPVGAAFAGQTLIAACMEILGLCIGIPCDQIGKLLEFIQGMPWDKILGLTGFRKGNKSSAAAAATDENKTSLVDEIKIPSVSELCSAGIKFSHTPWGLWDIKFDDKEGTLDLPDITLNATSEVVLRNLLAYEALSAKSGSKLELASYTDLMSGIIDTAEDARLLREMGIIKGPLSDDEVADLFNCMNMSKKSTGKPDKESNIERTIEKVNKYYNSKWKVKACSRAKKIVYAFWKVLPVLSTILLILLLSLHSYCNVYGCTRFLAKSGSP